MDRGVYVALLFALHFTYLAGALILVGPLMGTEAPAPAERETSTAAPGGPAAEVVDQPIKNVRTGNEAAPLDADTERQAGDTLFEDASTPFEDSGAPTAQPSTELAPDSGDVSPNRLMQEGDGSGPTAQTKRPKDVKQATLGGGVWLAAVGLSYALYRLTKTPEARILPAAIQNPVDRAIYMTALGAGVVALLVFIMVQLL